MLMFCSFDLDKAEQYIYEIISNIALQFAGGQIKGTVQEDGAAKRCQEKEK